MLKLSFFLRPLRRPCLFLLCSSALLTGCSKVYWRDGPCDVRSGKPELRFDFSGAAKKAEKQKDSESAACEQNRLKLDRQSREKQSHLSELYPRMQSLPKPSEALALLEGKVDRHFYTVDGGLSEIKDCKGEDCAMKEEPRKITPNLYEVYNQSENDAFSVLYRDDSKKAFQNCPEGQYAYWRINIEKYETAFGDEQKAPALVRLGCTANWSDPFSIPETEGRVSSQILPQSSAPIVPKDFSGKELPVPRASASGPAPVVTSHIQSLFPESAKPTIHDKRAHSLYKDIRPESMDN
ncbi:hypothetical protein FAI40_05605 [Acetobacteraceae bacterium]|nr:hypothetical protein FAI40_05605 [Acetobacteraceae bacterium]